MVEMSVRRLGHNVCRALVSICLIAAVSAPALTAQAAAAPTGDKLPSGVTTRLKQIDKYVGTGRAGDLLRAREAIREIEKNYGKQISMDHPEIKAAIAKIEAAEKGIGDKAAAKEEAKAKEQETKAATEAGSKGWTEKLRPYVTAPAEIGKPESVSLFETGGPTTEVLAARVSNYKKALAVFGEYKRTAPAAKSPDLESAEQDMERLLKTFAETVMKRSKEQADEAQKQLEYADKWLKGHEDKAAKKEEFLTLDRDQMAGIYLNIEMAAVMSLEDNPQVATLRKALADLKARDAKLRLARVGAARMMGDKFKGPEMEAIRKAVGEFLLKQHPQAKVLRTTVISPDWKEESVIEPTDSTRSAWRHRVTRSVTAQIGGKSDKGCFIYTIFVGKNRQSDGSWGDLYGHVMFTDPILEENVNR